MSIDWNEERARATGRGEGYYGEQQLSRQFAKERIEAEAKSAQERAEYEATPQGQLAEAKSRMRVLGAQMDQKSWDEMYDQNGWPHEPKPDAWNDLNLAERNAVLDARLAEVFRKRAGGQ